VNILVWTKTRDLVFLNTGIEEGETMNKLNENIAILEAKVKADEVKKIAEEKKEMQEMQ